MSKLVRPALFWLGVVVISTLLSYKALVYANTHQPDGDLIWLVTIHHQETYEWGMKDVQFFELRRGAEAALISIPKNSELAEFLRRHNNDKVVFTLGGGRF